MAHPYLCPVCRRNRTRFQFIYKLAQEVRKHADSGDVEFADDQWEVVQHKNRLDLDVRCLECGHADREIRFTEAARRDIASASRSAWSPPHRRRR